jgi:hypothetical protein
VVHIARGALNAQVDGMQGLRSERGGSPAGPVGMIGSQGAERVKGANTRSCSSAVLMEESAEQVASTHGAAVILGADGRPGQRIWWSQPECPVGTVAVVMLDIDPEDLLQVAAANDQQPVQALGADGPNPALGVGVGLWRPDWGHQDVGVL